MVRRRIPPPGGDDGYRVGYGKPPVHSRFQPGQSGNPAGRRKGVRNLMTDVGRILVKPVRLKEGGRTRQRTTQESVLLVLAKRPCEATHVHWIASSTWRSALRV